MEKRRRGRPRVPIPVVRPGESYGGVFLDQVAVWLGERSLRGLARRIGVTHGALSQIRTGRQRLTRDIVIKIARALREDKK